MQSTSRTRKISGRENAGRAGSAGRIAAENLPGGSEKDIGLWPRKRSRGQNTGRPSKFFADWGTSLTTPLVAHSVGSHMSDDQAGPSRRLLSECQICFTDQELFPLVCDHELYCRDCLDRAIRGDEYNAPRCPQTECMRPLQDEEIKAIVGESYFAELKRRKEEADEQASLRLIEEELSEVKHSVPPELEQRFMKRQVTACPNCQVTIERREGCNEITCTQQGCNAHFCYMCGDTWIQHSWEPGYQAFQDKHLGAYACLSVRECPLCGRLARRIEWPYKLMMCTNEDCPSRPGLMCYDCGNLEQEHCCYNEYTYSSLNADRVIFGLSA